MLGGLLDKKIKRFTDIMRHKYPDAVERWEHEPGMVLMRIKPMFAVTGAHSNGDTYIDYLDLKNRRAYSEKWGHY